MLKVYENAIDSEKITELRVMFDKVVNEVGLLDKFYINDNVFQMERTVINYQFPDMRKHCRLLINSHVPRLVDLKQSIMFTRVHYPSPVHVDVDEEYSKGVTLIIPLTFHDGIKTVVWKDEFINNSELTAFKNRFINETRSFTKKNAISKEVDISHSMSMYGLNMGDVMELDGVASWQPGNIIVFDKTQAHCSSNFITHVPFKDYLLVHTQ
jgi:hypothetical protein